MLYAGVPFGPQSSEAFNDEGVNLSVTLESKILRNERFCSFEVFCGPDATEETYQQLFSKLEPCSPLFYSITWHQSVFKGSPENHPSLRYFENLSNITLLHLPARGLSRKNVLQVLNRAVEVGKENIFALQGDSAEPDSGSNEIDFPHAIDLVKFIRTEFGSKFSIFVAGYPQVHPKSPSKEADLFYLKQKVDAGANFIITQVIFESAVFIEFVSDCRRVGIAVPIIPGVFLISSFKSMTNLCRKCEAKIPERMQRDLDSIKDDEAALQEYGIKSATELLEEIFNSGTACGVHLFTLNRSRLVLELCKRLGLCRTAAKQSKTSQLSPNQLNS